MKLFHSFALLALLLGGESTAAVKKETRKLVRLCCVLSSGNKFYWILQFPYTGSSYLSPRALLLACCINFQMYLYPTPETAGAPPTAVPTKSPVYVVRLCWTARKQSLLNVSISLHALFVSFLSCSASCLLYQFSDVRISQPTTHPRNQLGAYQKPYSWTFPSPNLGPHAGADDQSPCVLLHSCSYYDETSSWNNWSFRLVKSMGKELWSVSMNFRQKKYDT